MDNASRNSLSRDSLLDEAVVAYLEAVECGRAPTPDQWLARYPEVAGELAEFFADQAKVQRWTEPLVGMSAKTASTAADDPDQTASPDQTAAHSSRADALDDYELLHEIAHGGMGIVYKARQLSLNRIVALKMIRAGRLASSAERQRFRMEAEAAASLDHPHITPIYDVGEHQGRPYFSMKYIDSGSLAEHLPRFGEDPRATAQFMAAVARAVHHAHQRGILHRDLKPANILLDGHGQPYVTDFGLAGRVEGDSGITQSGAIVGTPSFMAPEQAAGQKGLTTAADVFSLGAILYTMLAGKSPFHAPTPLETVRRVLDEEPTRPRLLNSRLDRDLETICLKCLQKEPPRRYGSAESLAEDLDRWLKGEPIQARRSPPWERAWKKAKRNPKAAALATAAVMVLLIGVYFYAGEHKRLAEQKQLERQRVSTLEGESREFVHEAERKAASEDLQDLQDSEMLLEKALAMIRGEPLLREMRSEVEAMLRAVQEKVSERLARANALDEFRRFFGRRDEARFYGTLFTGLDAPANVEATRAAASAGLELYGITPGGGSLTLDRYLLDAEKTEVAAGCYELLLMLAEAEAQSSPPRWGEALRLLDRAQQLGPLTKTFHLRRARYLAGLKDQQGELAELEKASSIEASSVLDHFLLGEDFRMRGDVKSAVREFETILKREPGHFWAHYFLANCLLPESGRAAKAHLSACLSQRPDFVWCYLLRGIAHARLDDFDAAEEDFQHALAHPPPEPTLASELRYAVLVNRAVSHVRQEKLEPAAEVLAEAIAVQPQSYQAYWHLADVREQMNQLEAAVEQIKHALDAAAALWESGGLESSKIELAWLHHTRARLYARRTESEQNALDDLEKAIQAHPLAECYALRARILLRREQYLDAIAACDQALETSPRDAAQLRRFEIHELRAKALVKLESFPEAKRSLDLAVAESEQPTAEIHQLRGLVRAKLGDYSGAVSDYTQAISIAPDDPLTYEYRGRVYLVQDAFTPAWDDFEKAIALDPAGGEAFHGRAYIHARRGKAAAAVRDAEEALRREQRRAGENPRLLWNAALIHALAVAVVDADPEQSKLLRGRVSTQYRERAVELLRRALDLTPAEQRETFWRSYVAPEAAGAFAALAGTPEYVELEQLVVSGE